MMKPNYLSPWPCCVPSPAAAAWEEAVAEGSDSPRARLGTQGSCSCRANGGDSPSCCSQGSAQPLAVPLSPVPTRKPVSAIYIPRFDLASDMKRHVSQVGGSKQNAATVPHLCLHMIRSLAHTCLAATDPYLISLLSSLLSLHAGVQLLEATFFTLFHAQEDVVAPLPPLSGISPLSRVQPVWEMPSSVLLIACSARDGRYQSLFPP